MSENELLATVVILTYNGDLYLRRILTALREQKIDGEFEVIVIDSGSTDATLDIVGDYPEVRLHEIKNSEFGHGKTRNLAASLAKGIFVAFLTHDAIPDHDGWLRELLAPFSIDDRIKAVMGKQNPRPACFPLMRYEISSVFARFGPDFGTTLFYGDEALSGELDAITFYSDVNSATRRAFLIETIPYRDVSYAEDQMFGRDIIEAGYWKAYAPRASVEHSNDVTLHEFGLRIFDETVGLRRIGTPIGPLSRAGVIKYSLLTAVHDSARIVRDPAFSKKRKLYWLVINPIYHARKWANYRRASIVDLEDEKAIKAGSLEERRIRS
jgi:rhamnosyltransferase